jgi:hypothetical protein
MESILTSIKKLLGITEDYEHFDTDIIIHINSIFSTLNQLGVGPKIPFKITGSLETWDMFMKDWKTNDERADIDMVKTYVYLKVRLIFDPPSNVSVAEAFKEQAAEYEWRLNVACDETWLEDEEVSDG